MPKRKSYGDSVKDPPKISRATTVETGKSCTLDHQDSDVLKDVEVYAERCSEILDRLSLFLEKHPHPSDQPRMERFRKDLEILQKKATLPETIISVVGVTGSGKSTLVNALVDHSDLLPVSGIKACTAVAVEVTGNGSKDTYEAEIKFLSKEEWLDELAILRSLLTDKHGNMSQETTQSDAKAEKDKLTAVYGRYTSKDNWDLYTRENDVTKRLGDTVLIKENEADVLRGKIDKYIMSKEDGNPEYWPIVRKVRIRIPNCEACKNGVTVVDLPGTGDSNAARDRIAKGFLKHCHAMFVVAEVKRAVDEKTAKELLGRRFRRQLLFDGQYNNISFICTQTDLVSTPQIKRELNLFKKLDSIQKNKSEISALIHKLKNEGASMNEIAEQKERLKKEEMEEKNICIKARNEYCKTRLKEDFKNGLKEERSGGTTYVDDADETTWDEEYGMEDSSNLEVFCVSAEQYLALTANHDVDKVFSDPIDTEIPKLKQFVQMIASKRQSQALKYLIRSMRIFAGELCRSTEADGEDMQRQATHVKDISMEIFCSDLREELRNMKERIGKVFDRLIRDLKGGTELAITQSAETQKEWGSTYWWNTYRTICHGKGYYRSRKKKEIDFNIDLAEPMYKSITKSWDNVFNRQLTQYLRDYKDSVIVLLMKLSDGLSKGVKKPGKQRDEATRQYLEQCLNVCGEKIDCLISNVQELVKRKQKSINPVLTEKVKERMLPVYHKCEMEVGKDMFRRIQDQMENHVLENRKLMFHDAQAAMKEELRSLENEITEELEDSLDMLVTSLQQSVFGQRSGNEQEEARCIKVEIDQLCTDANIPESLLSPVYQPAADEVSDTENDWPGSWN